MRYVLFICFVLSFFLSYSQEFENKCFDEKEMTIYKSAHSKNGSLEGFNGDGIIFYVDDAREKVVLKSKFESIYGKSRNDSIVQKIIISELSRFRVCLFENYTDSIIFIPTILDNVAMIQEALDNDGNWKPIEVNSDYLWCGTEAFDEKEIQSKEFIELYVKKYCGDFRTKMRIKLRTSNGLIYSNIYEGFMNRELFNLEKLLEEGPSKLNFIDKSLVEEINRQRRL